MSKPNIIFHPDDIGYYDANRPDSPTRYTYDFNTSNIYRPLSKKELEKLRKSLESGKKKIADINKRLAVIEKNSKSKSSISSSDESLHENNQFDMINEEEYFNIMKAPINYTSDYKINTQTKPSKTSKTSKTSKASKAYKAFKTSKASKASKSSKTSKASKSSTSKLQNISKSFKKKKGGNRIKTNKRRKLRLRHQNFH